jgi:DNA-binding transcriptional ArsR family regulator
MGMADIFDVIADGTRREILQILLSRSSSGDGGTSVSQIVHELGVSQPTVSKHLKVLREADLVTVREEGQHRYYSLHSTPLEIVDDWLVPFFIDETDTETLVRFGRSPGARGAGRGVRRPGRGIREARRHIGVPSPRLTPSSHSSHESHGFTRASSSP